MLLLAVCIIANASAQSWLPIAIGIQHWGVAEGLSQNTVNAMVQDKDGFVWLGTQDGLNRFDGSHFKIYRHQNGDTQTLSDNFVTRLFAENSGKLWVGTRHGVNQKIGTGFQAYFTLPGGRNGFHESTNTIFLQNGNIHFCNNYYLNTIKAHNEAKKVCDFATQTIKGWRKEGKYLFANNCIFLYDGNVLPRKIDSISASTTGLLQNAIWWKNKLLLACTKGLYLYEPETKRLSLFKSKMPEVIDLLVTGLSDQLWVATLSGLYMFDEAKHETHITQKDGLSSNQIASLMQDFNGNIWAGTFDAGVNLINLKAAVFNATYIKNPHSFCEFDSELFMVSDGAVFKQVNGKPIVWFDGVKDISAIAFDAAGRLWAGTKTNGMYVLKNKKNIKHIANLNPLNNEYYKVFYLLSDSKKRMWVATECGLYQIDSNWQVKAFLQDGKHGSISHGYVLHLHETPDGKIVASTAGGINSYNEKENTFTTYNHEPDNPNSLGYNIALCSFTDSKGNLWVGTKGGGLSLINLKTKTVKNYGIKQGLPNDYVHGILEGDNGKLWLATGQGLCCFNPQTESVQNIYKNSGLASNEFGTNSSVNFNGELYFGGPEGYIHFSHRLNERMFENSRMVLSGIRVNYTREIGLDLTMDNNSIPQTSVRLSEGEAPKLKLNYKDNIVAFDFAEINFADPGHAKLMYMLKGFDKDWQTCNPAFPTANYTNLSPGNYELSYGIGQEKKSISITIHPPFWLTWWFLSWAGIGLALLAILVIRYFSQVKLRKRLREIELRQKMQGERERISRELHDNIGSQLTVMISSLDNLSYRSEKKNDRETADKIDGLSDFARSTMQQLRETIWALNKDEITAEEWGQKVQDYLSKVRENVTTTIRFENNISHEVIFKSIEVINLFRIMQEAVNNALKHAEANQIVVKLFSQNQQTCLMIKDDGKGFETGDGLEGHYGLDNMRQRAAELDASIEFETTKGSGTTIIVTLK